MCSEPEVKISVDGRHIWIDNKCYEFHTAKKMAREVLERIAFEEIWGNRNDRRTKCHH